MQRVRGEQQRSKLPLLYRLPTRGKNRDARMTNKLGTVETIIHSKCKIIMKEGRYICDVPEDRRDTPDGMIAYLDHAGMLQFTDGDPNDG
jgi:hypothetical protein